MKRARPNDLDKGTKGILKEISESCQTCQKLGPKPIRFKASIPIEDQLVFGSELSIDLMFIDSKAILHIVDSATRFSSAVFLDDYGQRVEGIWNAFIDIWCTMYTGFPNRRRTDAGPVFTSTRWRHITDMTGIEIRISGVEAHNSLGIGERLHDPLRRIYRMFKEHFPNLSQHTALKIALKAMNDTNGENGLVPSLLTFGIIPRFPIISTDLPAQRERMQTLAGAQMEMNAIVSERRTMQVLTKWVPQSVDAVYAVYDKVLVYREIPKKWEGPFVVTKIEGSIITVKILSGEETNFSTQQVKLYISPDMTNPSEFLNDMLSPFRSTSCSIPLGQRLHN